ncbi:MAG: DUF7901 domain-containing protein [Planctomycetota bacterium]
MKKLIFINLCVLFAAGTALADWIPGDDFKMHYPQLPDPFGLDVMATVPKILADDFQCAESGFITDVHFWGSWRDDVIGDITNVHLSIHADIPDPDGTGRGYSMPGLELWSLDTDGAIILPVAPSPQGWYNPNTAEYYPDNHVQYFQYNISIPEQQAFYQEQGTIYWLDISVTTPFGEWGWKTSEAHWNDDAVWSDDGQNWIELRHPVSGESLDMAFVIAPEPATIALLGLGGLVFLRRRR